MSIGDRQPSLLVLRNGKTVRHAARAQLFGPAQIGRCCKLAVKLPALKDLGQLGDHLPVVVIDSREQAPLPLRRLPFVTGTLQCAFEDQLWDRMISRPAVMNCGNGE